MITSKELRDMKKKIREVFQVPERLVPTIGQWKEEEKTNRLIKNIKRKPKNKRK